MSRTPRLDHCDVDLAIGELAQRRCRQHLELRGADRCGFPTDAVDGTLEVSFCSVDPEALLPEGTQLLVEDSERTPASGAFSTIRTPTSTSRGRTAAVAYDTNRHEILVPN